MSIATLLGCEKRRIRQVFAATIAFLCVFTAGCMTPDNTLCAGDPNADVILEATLFRETAFRIAVAERNGLLPSRKFWFGEGDDKTVSYGWSDVLFRHRDPDDAEVCDYLTPREGCRECSGCSSRCTDGSIQVLLSGNHSFGDLTELSSDGTVRMVAQAKKIDDFCFSTPAGPNQFQPSFTVVADSAVYGFTSKSTCGQSTTQWQFETKIVRGPQPILQPLEPYRDATDPAPRYRFRMPEEDGFLRENFSNRLRVKKVRVLLGVRNLQTGAEMILDDPESLRRVRPSRILFLPDLLDGNVNRSPTESTNRCYVDPAVDDGGFDMMTNCRRSPGGPHFQQNVTPTFQAGRFSETLDWVIEYKTGDGIPALPEFQTTQTTQEFPVIEWTIDQN